MFLYQRKWERLIYDICDHSFSNRRNLKRHKKEGHSTTTVYFVCIKEACSATFLRQGYLRDYLKNRHHLQPAIIEALVAGQVEKSVPAESYRRRGKTVVSPIVRAELTMSEQAQPECLQPAAIKDADDVLSASRGRRVWRVWRASHSVRTLSRSRHIPK